LFFVFHPWISSLFHELIHLENGQQYRQDNKADDKAHRDDHRRFKDRDGAVYLPAEFFFIG